MLPSSHSDRRPGIGLTPLIDVVFILLIFFMLVMQFSRYQQVQMSSISSSEVASEDDLSQDSILITLQGNGLCLYKEAENVCQQIIRKIPKEFGSPVYLKFTDDANLGNIINLKTLISQAGYSVQIGLDAKHEGG